MSERESISAKDKLLGEARELYEHLEANYQGKTFRISEIPHPESLDTLIQYDLVVAVDGSRPKLFKLTE